MGRAGASRESGQVAVEAALIMPLMVFMTLGIIQLTMMQHAKLMTEYAAYQAARAGIVWSGNNERMKDAAVMALLPTMGRTDGMGQVATTYARYKVYDLIMRRLPWGATGVRQPDSFNGISLFGVVRVDTINPAMFAPISSIWKLRGGGGWQELDFDGPETFPEVPALGSNLDKFYDFTRPDTSELSYRKATRLSIRLRYWYEMRVPFANWIIFTAWFASNARVALYGAIDRPTMVPFGATVSNRQGNVMALPAMVRGVAHEKGYDTLFVNEMRVLWAISQGLLPGVGKRYFIPLTATYSMRMQSNFHRKWILHNSPRWGF